MDALKELFYKIKLPSTLIGTIISTIGLIIILSENRTLNLPGKFFVASLLIIFGGIILTTNYLITELKEGFEFLKQLFTKSIRTMQTSHEKDMETLRGIYETKSSVEKVSGYSSVTEGKSTEVQL